MPTKNAPTANPKSRPRGSSNRSLDCEVRLPDPPLLLVTDRRQARRPLPEVVGAALASGCRWISLREKDLPDDEQIPLARMLLPMARRHGARLLVHGEAALAKLAGTDGVHLQSGSRSEEHTSEL